MTANPKLIKDLINNFSQSEPHRAYLEVNRADQSNSTKTTFRDKNYLKEARQVSFTHVTDTDYTIYITLIPVWSQDAPADKVVFLATVEIYVAAGKSGTGTVLAAYPPRRSLLQSHGGEGAVLINASGHVVYANSASSERGFTFTYLTDVEV